MKFKSVYDIKHDYLPTFSSYFIFFDKHFLLIFEFKYNFTEKYFINNILNFFLSIFITSFTYHIYFYLSLGIGVKWIWVYRNNFPYIILSMTFISHCTYVKQAICLGCLSMENCLAKSDRRWLLIIIWQKFGKKRVQCWEMVNKNLEILSLKSIS